MNVSVGLNITSARDAELEEYINKVGLSIIKNTYGSILNSRLILTISNAYVMTAITTNTTNRRS